MDDELTAKQIRDYTDKRIALTAKQSRIYHAILAHYAKHAKSPTMRDLCVKFRIGSPNGIMCHLAALIKKGWLTRGPKGSSCVIHVPEMDEAIKAAAKLILFANKEPSR